MEFWASVLLFIARLIDPPGCLQFSQKNKIANPPTGLCEHVGPTLCALSDPLSPEGKGLCILYS